MAPNCSLVKVEFFGKVKGRVGEEVLHVAAVFLGGTAQTGGAFYKAAYAVHLQQVILVLRGDVLHHLGYKLGAYAVLNSLENAERVGHGRFAHLNGITLMHHFGWLDLDAVY